MSWFQDCLINSAFAQFAAASKQADFQEPFCLILKMCCTMKRFDFQKGWDSELSRNRVLLKCPTFSYSKVLKCVSSQIFLALVIISFVVFFSGFLCICKVCLLGYNPFTITGLTSEITPLVVLAL